MEFHFSPRILRTGVERMASRRLFTMATDVAAGRVPANRATPSAYCRDLTSKIDLRERVLFRDDVINQLIEFLEKRKENSPVLVGEAGVGKTAIVEELARRIISGSLKVNDSLGRTRFDENTHILSLDLGGLQSLRNRPDVLDTEIKGIIEFIENEAAAGHKIILWIDEIHLLPGDFSRLDQYLKEPVGKGIVQIIGATTNNEYRRSFEKDSALHRRFPDVFVRPLSESETLHLLDGVSSFYETVHGVRLQSNALLKRIVTLASRYLPDRVLPGSAITVLDHSLASVSKRQEMLAMTMAESW